VKKNIILTVSVFICLFGTFESTEATQNQHFEKKSESIEVTEEITVELKNKSKNSVNVVVLSANGGSKTSFSIAAGTTKRTKLEVGASVYVNGSLSFKVNANMNKTEQLVAN
jgi:hypothetical protein